MKKGLFVFLRSALLCVFIIAFGCLLLVNPSVTGRGVAKGLNTVGSVLLPSLFPFVFLAGFMEKSGASDAFGRIFSFPTRVLFRLPEEASAAVVMSFTGGFPVGAGMIENLIDENKITCSQASRMLAFCINAGPAFIISSVGSGMLGSQRAGVLLFCSLTLSACLIGFFSGFILSPPIAKTEKIGSSSKASLSAAFTRSASSAVTGMLFISACVIVFSVLCEQVGALNIPDGIMTFIMSLLEVTNGAVKACGKYPLPVTAAIIGFSGLCVHFQVMPAVVKSGMKLRYFLVSRVLNAALASGICRVLLRFFPVEISVFAPVQKPVVSPFGVSLPCCIALALMSICLISDIAPRKKV